MKKRRHLGLWLFIVLLLAPMAYYGFSMYGPLRLPHPQTQVAVTLGSSAEHSMAILTKAGIIQYPRVFRLAWMLAGRPGLQAGLYVFRGRTNQASVLHRLIQGQSTPLNVLIVPGWTLSMVMQQLRKKSPYLRVQDLPLEARRSDALFKAGIGNKKSAEGWLFPDTYRYVPGTSAISVLRRAYLRMNRNLGRLWKHRASGLPLDDPYQALILASIVQKEGAPPAQQARIAAVFLNRLRQGMPLQSDPTIIYALGSRYTGKLMPSEMQIKSPYNTYIHKGLPPTPIAMPGLSSLMAVLHPAHSEDLYFIAQGTAYHYSATYAEHIEQIHRYLQPPKNPPQDVSQKAHHA